MAAVDHKEARDQDFEKILASSHPRKVVVAGPGTGKSYLFRRAIEQEQAKGKSKFLAVTFIGKLGDALADELGGLATTATLHGFARKLVLDKYPKGWTYYPKITEIIAEDLRIRGIKNWKIGDGDYEERTNYYKAVGDSDVVWYATQLCKKDKSNIPQYDLIVVDEFQDFDEVEAGLIDILATRNKVLVVGDDDQALYLFKGSSPKYIRQKYHADKDFERHTLRFCSRCTEVIIGGFHDIVERYELNKRAAERVQKDYVCYLPANPASGKKQDSDANPKIVLCEQAPVGAIAHLIRFELERLLEKQSIKSVLVIGESRSCKSILHDIAHRLRDFGFKYVDHKQSEIRGFEFDQDGIDAYKFLAGGRNEALAWRLLATRLGGGEGEKLVKKHYADFPAFVNAIPEKFKQTHQRNSGVLERIIEGPDSKRRDIADSSIEKLSKELVSNKRGERDLLINQLVQENKVLPRPLNALDITVTSILRSKGLGADVVFVVGFDQGKFPAAKGVEDAEIYQMLVALTRAKKRIYLVNSIGSSVSDFAKCLKAERLEVRGGK